LFAEKKDSATLEEVVSIASDIIPGAITDTRRYQTLQALLNCTRKSLLPETADDAKRREWQDEIRALERSGIR
ncbi:MAG: hypothetical protein PHW04_18770, partial [Candidatus Wallbacteria bacterium]|nr:hypothetical protein [Candidatus Wallbacteria bacterium]